MRRPISVDISEEGNILFEPNSKNPNNKYDYYLPTVIIKPLHEGLIVKSGEASVTTKLITPYRKEAFSSTNQSTKWIYGVLLAALIMLILYLIISYYDQPPDVGLSNGDSSQRTETDQKLNPESIADLFSNPMLVKYKDILTPEIMQKGCIIITGSFKNKRNAMTEYNRIESKGYSAYIEETANSNRVGVVFNCGEYDLKDYLSEVRKHINNKAWYLRPDYKPTLE